MAEQRYYWLRLREDFFSSKRIKKLRRLAGGDTLTIIYLKMQLKSIKTDGVLSFTGLERSFAEELALDLDENPEDVGLLLNYLLSVGLIETSDNINFLLPYAEANIGSEGISAQKMRDIRKRKALPSQCDNNVITELQEIEKEKEKEIDIRRKFTPPSLEDVKAYCQSRHNGVNPQRFYDYYQASDWHDASGKPVKNWKQKVITWEKFTPEHESGIDPMILRVIQEEAENGIS